MSDPDSPYETTQTPLSRRQRRRDREDDPQRLHALPFLLAAGVVVILTAGVLWWFLIREPPEEEPPPWSWSDNPADGIHARNVPAEDWEAGWCLTDYENEDSPADVIDCERTHDAQVLLRRELPEGDYPGSQELAEAGQQWCHEDIELNEEALADLDEDEELEIQIWHPTESTWEEDDRLISCVLTRPAGDLAGDFAPQDAGEGDNNRAGENAEEGQDPREDGDEDADEGEAAD